MTTWRTWAALTLVCGVSTPTMAQVDAVGPAAPSATAVPAPPTDSGDIVVTAQKKSETVQRVAAAITAVSSTSLTQTGVTSLNSISQIVPSIQVSPIRNQSQIFIRGVGQTLSTPNADPAVAVNINGVYVPSEMTGGAFFDIDRIEVLPGPQGTLYGRNSTGGVVNIITRRPGAELEADGFLEIGNYNRVQASAGVDIPLGHDVAIRAAATLIRHDGYFSNGNDDQNTYGGRLTGTWRPGDRTTIIGSVAYSHDGGFGAVQQNVPAPGDIRTLNYDPKALGYYLDFRSTYTSLQVDHDLTDELKFTYLGGYNYLHGYQRDALWPGPPVALLVNDFKTNSVTQEGRFNLSHGRFDAIAGVYYFYTKSGYTADLSPTPVIRTLNGPFVSRSHGVAGFGQITYSLAESLRLTGGLRYSTTTKEVDGTNATIINGGTPTIVGYNGSDTMGRLDWRAGVEFDVAPRSLLYGSVATGFTPGGFSTAPVALGQSAAAPFAAVKLTAYTAGIKNRFLDNRLTINVEGFYYDYKNYQVSARNAITAQNTVYNAAKATIYGAQIDTRFVVTHLDELTVDLSLLHAKADQLTTPAGSFNGFDLPLSPHQMINAGYRHSFPIGEGRIDAAINFQYVSSRWGIYTHAAQTDIAANTQTDLNLTYHAPHDHWSIGAWVRNVEDEDVKTQGISGAIPGPASFYYAPPRTFGGRFGFNL